MEPLTTTLAATTGKLAGTAVSTATTMENIGRMAVGRLGRKALVEADPEVVHPLALSLSVLNSVNAASMELSKPSVGGCVKVEQLCDLQKEPTCWNESLENIVQIMCGDSQGIMNRLSGTIHSIVEKNPAKFDAGFVNFPGVVKPVLGVPAHSYPAILKEVGKELKDRGIELNDTLFDAKSIPFSHQALQHALAEHRPAILSGSVRFLPEKYPMFANAPGAEFTGHAVVALDYNPNTLEYTILDSNYPEPCTVSVDAIGRFMSDEGSRLCVMKNPAINWEHKTAYIGKSKAVFSLGEKAESMKTGGFDSVQRSSPVSFGTSWPVLQISAELSKVSTKLGNSTIPGALLTRISNLLSGANEAGMETIKESAKDAAKFYGIKTPNIFYEEGQPGVMWGGLSNAAYDDWIGGDPKVLSSFANTYGGDFVKAVMGHEIGHHVFDKLGFRKTFEKTFGFQYGRICNEAVADYLSGLYCGSLGLNGRGFAEFLANDTSYLSGFYPKGSIRSALFKEGYATANSYPWRSFQSILRDPSFNLHHKVAEVAARQIPSSNGSVTSENHVVATSKRKKTLHIDPAVRTERHAVAFNGFRNTEKIADIQSGRNCSYEAMENLAQLQIGDRDGLLNDLSDKFHQFVKTHPEQFDAIDRGWWGFWHNDRWYVDMSKYPEVLRKVGVETKAMPFSHSELQKALAENRAVIIGGDVVHLPPYRGKVGGHALVAIDWNPNHGGRYTLLDSNSETTYSVSADAIEKFAKSTEKFEGGISMIVAEKPASWPWKTSVEDPRILDVFSDYEKFLGRVDNELSKRLVHHVSFRGRADSFSNGEAENAGDLPKRIIGMFEGVVEYVRNFIKYLRGEESPEDFAKRIRGMSTEDLVKESGELGKGSHELYEQSGGWQGVLQRKMNYYKQYKQDLEDRMAMFMRSLPDDPKILRQLGNKIKTEIEVLRAKRHEQEIRHQMYEQQTAKMQKMTPDQYRAASEHGLTKLDPSTESTAFSDQYRNLYKVGFDGTVERVFVNGRPARV